MSFTEPQTRPASDAADTDAAGDPLARDAEDPAFDLRVQTARGGAAVLVSQGCRFVLLFALQIILARLLMPEDFGLVAVVTSITVFFSLFNDLGLPLATVQRREISEEQVSLLFWLNTVWGLVLALLTAASAPLFARFYSEPRLGPMLIWVSAGFVLVGLSSQHRALLKRRMRFTRLALVDLLSLVAGACVAVALARLGFHYWALIYMRLATTAAMALGLLLACGWRPGRPRLAANVRPLLAFGSHVTSFDLMSFVVRNADNLLIGWYSGPRVLGLYYKAYQMLLVPSQQFYQPLGGVVIPALSRLQSEPVRYGAYYHRGILLAAAAGMPLVTFLFVGADWIVPLLLGNQWDASVPIFRALALAAFVAPLDLGAGWLVISLGRTARQFKWNLMTMAFTLAGFAVGVRWGGVGVALSFSLCRAGLLVPKLVYSCKGTHVRWADVLRSAAHPSVASVAAAAGLFALTRALPFLARGVAGLAASGLCFALLYIGVWLLLPGGRRTLRGLFGLMRYLR